MGCIPSKLEYRYHKSKEDHHPRNIGTLHGKLRICNVKSTSPDKPQGKYGNSWIKFWEGETGEKATKCIFKGCEKTTKLKGGHLYVKHEKIKYNYIGPICSTHNSKSYDYDKTNLVYWQSERNITLVRIKDNIPR